MSTNLASASRSSTRTLLLLSLVSTALLTSRAAQSQSADIGTDASLAPVVVTAARVAQPQTDALPFTTVISAEEIRNSQAVDLPSLLRREAGIQFTQNGGYGQASGLFVRGAETRQTLVLIDGVPLTKQDATGTVSIEHLMLDQIDHIEIVRGNVSSIYGSSAIGGVIQIFTRRGDGPPKVTAQVEAGSRGTTRIAAGISGSSGGQASGGTVNDKGTGIGVGPSGGAGSGAGIGNGVGAGTAGAGGDAIHYALNVSNFHTEGFSSLNPAQVPAANPDRDGYRNSSVAGSLSRDFGRDNQIGANFTATQGRFDFDSSFGVPSDLQRGTTDVGTVTVYTKNRLSENWTSRLAYSDARDRNANHYDTSFGITDDRYQSRTRMLQWTNEITLSPTWSATAGYERQWQGLSTDDGYGTVFDVNRNANSVYAGVQGKLGQHQLQLNLRRDLLDRVDGATTGYLGYGYLLSPQWKALASVATGFAAPPLGYLYSPGFGNPDLQPERSRSGEIGLQYADAGTLLRAALFDTRTRQQLEYDPVTNVFGNIARASNRGLEVSASTTLAATALRASLTLQDPRDETTDTRLRRRARTLASIAADRAFGAWQFGGDVGYTGNRPDAPTNLAAYTLVNLTASYQLSKAVQLYGRVDNLFDRDYQTASGYNQPPRGIFAGVRWQQ